jgi:hypothetical protein
MFENDHFQIVLTLDVFLSAETTPFFENSNGHMNEGLTLLIAISENR